MNQLAIAVFGLSALWLAMGNWPPGRKWAPVIGLCGQPFWMYFAWQADGWGILALTAAYTAVYARGAWVQWRTR
jgi:hypothetical protein